MALVTLTLRDTEDGSLDIQAHAEPYIPTPDSGETPTPAQTAALLAIAAIHSAASFVAEIEEPEDDAAS